MHEDHGRSGSRARLGLCLPEWGQDAFWVQVYDAIYKRSRTLPVELIPLSVGTVSQPTTPQERLALLEDVVTQELDVLIGWPFPESLAHTLLEGGLAIVHLSETTVRHPLSVSPLGLGAAAAEVATFLAEQVGGQGQVLVVGGLSQPGLPDDGKSRATGAARAFARYPKLGYRHLPTHWDRERARPQLEEALTRSSGSFDAILGFSDTLALLAGEVARELGRDHTCPKLAGINGDPMAIAAILQGNLHATIETSAAHLGARAVELACSIAYGQACEPHFGYQTRLITAETAPCVAAEKLAALDQLMSIPFELRERERMEHLARLETSLNISRQLSTVLDEHELPSVLGTLIRDAYGFEHLHLVYWQEETRAFRVLEPDVPGASHAPSPEAAEIYRDALVGNRLMLVPDQQSSLRYEQDSRRPQLRSRVVLPVRCGGKTLGLLDLSADRIVHCTRVRLLGLEALADQFGVAVQHARFYRQLLETNGASGRELLPPDESRSLPLHLQEPPSRSALVSSSDAQATHPGTSGGKSSSVSRRAVAYVRDHYSEPISRGDLAADLGVSENYLTDLFHREMGTSLWTYLNRFRIKQAKALLLGTELKITEIACRVGFDDPAYFSRVFRRYTGRSPRAFRKSPPYVEAAGE
jgi:AraC-like DNA-binding protein/ABC-type sugar transport system substrate-binding protein